MKSILNDIISHTVSIADVEMIKVTGTDKKTEINANTTDKLVIVNGTLNAPVADFIGVFGMPNLAKLKTIVGLEDYDAEATIQVIHTKKDGKDVPSNIHFETKTGDFVNDYRFMAQNVAEEKIKTVTFKGATWNVEFEPTVLGISRLKRQVQANSEEQNFKTRVENGELRIYFGDPATHSGNFVFQTGIKGKLTKDWLWPVKQFLNIMDVVGDKTIKISDQGVTHIQVDSGLAIYDYYIPALAK